MTEDARRSAPLPDPLVPGSVAAEARGRIAATPNVMPVRTRSPLSATGDAVNRPRGAAGVANKPADRKSRPSFECVALVLQGGGALGAYQGGVYEALAEAGLHPDWVAGISIGSINAALIAGSSPQARVANLRAFWESVTAIPNVGWALAIVEPFLVRAGDAGRRFWHQAAAGSALLGGAPGFFQPRPFAPWLYPNGSTEATSYYDTAALKATLERLVDFERINAAGAMRFSVGAVNVRSGNFAYFDNTTHTIGPEHVMASGALPPGFPAVEVDGEPYWDGGLVSNTPLQWVLDSDPPQDTLAFQVDLWSARGEVPGSLADAMTRQKEIQYSSRTRASTDQFERLHRLRCALACFLDELPETVRNSPEAAPLRAAASRKVCNVVQLIYRSKGHEGQAKDYEFSHWSMDEHWRAGYHDTVHTLRHPEALARPSLHQGVATFDRASHRRR